MIFILEDQCRTMPIMPDTLVPLSLGPMTFFYLMPSLKAFFPKTRMLRGLGKDLEEKPQSSIQGATRSSRAEHLLCQQRKQREVSRSGRIRYQGIVLCSKGRRPIWPLCMCAYVCIYLTDGQKYSFMRRPFPRNCSSESQTARGIKATAMSKRSGKNAKKTKHLTTELIRKDLLKSSEHLI